MKKELIRNIKRAVVAWLLAWAILGTLLVTVGGKAVH